MSPAIVLDAGAFDVLDTSTGTALRALLRRAAERGGETKSPAVVLAEVCRGAARTRRVEAALARDLVNMNAESEAMMEGVGGLVDCGAGRVMEVVWPSGAAVRTEAPNHHEGRWLMTVVLSVVGKGAAVTASGVDREDER